MIKIQIIKENRPRTTKMDRFIHNLQEAYKHGGSGATKELCRNTRGAKAVAVYRFVEEVLETESDKDLSPLIGILKI